MLNRAVASIVSICFLAMAPAATAQTAPPAATGTTAEGAPVDTPVAATPWLRDPAISPDGTWIAFRFAGQIWIVPADGGDAVPLTPGGVHAATPVWSPDGATIAFAADTFGPMNIFAIPVAGGEAKRLTWNQVDQAPTGFSPDGASVMFWSPGLGDIRQTGPIPTGREDGRQLYQVPVAGGRDTMVLPNAALEAHWDPPGRRLLYTGPSIEQPFRRHQVSSAARQVWVYDAATGQHRRLTDDPHESRSAVWAPDGGIDYLDETSGTLEIWHRDADLGHPTELTRAGGDPIRFLSISRGGDLAFTRDGGLYRLRQGETEPVRVAIRLVHASFPGDRPFISRVFDDFALSPDGREFAVVARGEIAVASIDGRDVKRLPHTAGEERDPSFSPDGRHIVYASERDRRWDLYESSLVAPGESTFSQATQVTERRLTTGSPDAMMPVYAPDGRRIAYVADRDSVRVLDPASGADIEVLPAGQNYSYDDWPWPIAWSPDSRWLALPVQPSLFLINLALVPADGSRPAIRPVPAGGDQWDPQWSPDGGLLTWLDESDVLHMAYEDHRWMSDLHGAFTSRNARVAFEKRRMVPVAGDRPAGPPERDGDVPRAQPDPRDAAAEREAPPRGPIPVEPDRMADLGITLSQAPGQILFGTVLADGVSVLTVEQSPNAKGDGLVVTGTIRDLRQERRRTLFTALPYQRDSPLRLSRDRRRLYFLSRTGGQDSGTDGLMEVDIARGTPRLIRIAADTTRDEAEARRAAFEQFWTLTAKKFYDPGFTGVDWTSARRRYERFLPSLADTRDLAELVSEMAGELAASHTGGYVHPFIPPSERIASLGLYYDERYAGPGMKVAAVIPGGPFDTGASAIRAGDVIRTVDGEPVPEAGGIRRRLLGYRREFAAVEIEHPDGTRFTETIVTIALDKERDIADRWWTERKRDAVVATSCGRLGYVYLAGMDAESYRKAFSDVFGRFGQADGLVIDIRDNGGGNLHNQLVTLLSGKTYFKVVPPRGGPAQDEPRDRWTKPSVLVMNAASYSDSSLFPLAYRDLHLGRLVGDAVAGTGTEVWWVMSRIIPGLAYGVPQLPFREVDGTFSEGHEIAPDIPMPSDPTAWQTGEDPQLAAAIKSLMPAGARLCPP